MMNDVLAIRWRQISLEIKKRWSALTDQDLAIVEGQKERLLDLLIKRYGYAKKRAQQEVECFMNSTVGSKNAVK